MIKNLLIVMYKPIASLRAKVKRLKITHAWKRDAEKIRSCIETISQINLPITASYLILAPHSDDEWIGCSQIIRKMQNVHICNMDMKGGDAPDCHKERYTEMKNMAEVFSKEIITISQNKNESLSSLLLKLAPDYILLPYYKDWHKEHIEVMCILKNAIQRTGYDGSILMFQVSVPVPLRDCNACIPMSQDEQSYKWKMFDKIYKTQSFMSVKRFMAYERITGGLVNEYAAEVYSCVRAEDWIKNLDKNILPEDERSHILSRLNDVSYMYRLMNER